MKLLFVTSMRPDLVKVWVCQERSPGGSLLPPVDIASLAATARANGHTCRIADLRLAVDPLAAYRRHLGRFLPDAVVMNLSTTGAESDYALLDATPSSVARICFGTHAQSLRDEAFERGVDHVLLGDPEAALLNWLDGSGRMGPMAGVVSKTDPHARVEPALWNDLDTMPWPALDLLDLDGYRSPTIRRGKRFSLLLGSRGCPHGCTYCLYPVLFGRKPRYRSVQNLVDEMEHVYQAFGVRAFYFLDATFNFARGRVEAFAEALLARGLKVDWSCNMRVTPVSAKMLALMKRAGCDWIYYGVEDQDFLKETRKGTTREATIEAFRRTREAGISTIAFTMAFARPGLDERTYARNILRVLSLLKADAFQCNAAIPFPGTPMWSQEQAAGRMSSDWSQYDPHGATLPYESQLDLNDVRRRVYRGFMLRHPWRTLRAALRMDSRALASIATAFLRDNVWPGDVHWPTWLSGWGRSSDSLETNLPATGSV